MRDSTVLVVLILVTLGTVGTATGGKWERVTLFTGHNVCACSL